MHQARAYLGVAVVKGIIYAIGGDAGPMSGTGTALSFTSHVVNTTEEYDPLTDSWTTKTPPIGDIWSTVSFVIDNKIYTIGGDSDNVYGLGSGNFFEIYDPATDSWSFGASSQVYGLSLTVAETTGANSSKRISFFDLNQTVVYDSLSGNWTEGTAMPTDRVLAKAIAVDDTIYLVGGRTGEMGLINILDPSAVNEQYVIPEFPSWTPMLFTLVVLAVAVAIYRSKLIKIQSADK
ncbi:MAG: hypothetical protein JSW14_02690 [Candidatus Bathyarchaeum sp.]|nr:MAG: hypothetical protein JSW14_02690 [Candidatus Bathyarchaeum sp.]